ncbi:MAG TPA: hypothetical protein VI636_22775 [Candidatus Angelobacter sp.]
MKTARLLETIALAILLGFIGCKGSGTTGAPSTASASSAPSSGSASTALPDFGSPRQVEVVDPMFNMVAETINVPASWKFESTVLHGPGCPGEYYAVVFRTASADFRYGVQALPTVQWAWADDDRLKPKGGACKYMAGMSAAEYGTLIAPRMRPGSEVDKIERAPIADSLQQYAQQTNQKFRQQAAAMGNPNPASMTADAQRLLIHYDLNGQPEEEWLVVQMYVTRFPRPVMANRPGQVLQTVIMPVYNTNVIVMAMRAPKGQLQSAVPVFSAINGSTKVNQQYQSMLSARSAEFNNRMIAQSWQSTHTILQAGAEAGARLQSNAQAFIQHLQQEGDVRRANFNARMLQKSAHAQDVSDYLLDQQLYVNPTTGRTTTQSSQYNNTYSNGNGAIMQTNSQYNPDGLVSGNWIQMQPIHH